jgi:hypothetical protein
MGQILHGSGRTTEALPRAIQHSQESPRVLAEGIKLSDNVLWEG